jgi:hypothetical protein
VTDALARTDGYAREFIVRSSPRQWPLWLVVGYVGFMTVGAWLFVICLAAPFVTAVGEMALTRAALGSGGDPA